MLNHTIHGDGGPFQPLRLIQLYAQHAQVPSEMRILDPDMLDVLESVGSSGSGSVVEGNSSSVASPYSSPGDPELATNLSSYAAWAISPDMLPTLYDELDVMLPLDALIDMVTDLQWRNTPPFFRQMAAVYGAQTVSVPYTTEAPVIFYRRDVFDRLGLSVPATWEEAIFLAKRVNSVQVPCTAASQDNATCTAPGFCFGLPKGCYYDGMALAAIYASLVGQGGSSAGLFVDPATMQALFNGPAMAEALRIYRELAALSPPPTLPQEAEAAGSYGPPPGNAGVAGAAAAGEACERAAEAYYAQNCVWGMGLTTLFKTLSFAAGGALRSHIGTSPLPGSHQVLDRATGQLVNCTQAICPNAEVHTYGPASWPSGVPGPHAGPVWVNRVPFFGRGTFALAINKRAPLNHQLAAWRAIVYAMSYGGGWPFVLDPTSRSSPVRVEHLSADNVDRWVAAGYSRDDTLQYLNTLRLAINHPSTSMGMRIKGAHLANEALARMAVSAATVPNATVDELLPILDDAFQHIQAVVFGGQEAFTDAYRRDLGYRADEEAAAAAPGRMSRLSAGQVSGIILGSCAVAGLALALAVRRMSWRRNSRRMAPVDAPGYGPDTSLLITDVQESTHLWEVLDAEVMDTALNLHNGCVRELLSKHNGYECHTEGDSFIVAFKTPVHAVAFAIELQAALLVVEWPEELLQQEVCKPVTVQALPANGIYSTLTSPLPRERERSSGSALLAAAGGHHYTTSTSPGALQGAQGGEPSPGAGSSMTHPGQVEGGAQTSPSSMRGLSGTGSARAAMASRSVTLAGALKSASRVSLDIRALQELFKRQGVPLAPPDGPHDAADGGSGDVASGSRTCFNLLLGSGGAQGSDALDASHLAQGTAGAADTAAAAGDSMISHSSYGRVSAYARSRASPVSGTAVSRSVSTSMRLSMRDLEERTAHAADGGDGGDLPAHAIATSRGLGRPPSVTLGPPVSLGPEPPGFGLPLAAVAGLPPAGRSTPTSIAAAAGSSVLHTALGQELRSLSTRSRGGIGSAWAPNDASTPSAAAAAAASSSAQAAVSGHRLSAGTSGDLSLHLLSASASHWHMSGAEALRAVQEVSGSERCSTESRLSGSAAAAALSAPANAIPQDEAEQGHGEAEEINVDSDGASMELDTLMPPATFPRGVGSGPGSIASAAALMDGRTSMPAAATARRPNAAAASAGAAAEAAAAALAAARGSGRGHCGRRSLSLSGAAVLAHDPQLSALHNTLYAGRASIGGGAESLLLRRSRCGLPVSHGAQRGAAAAGDNRLEPAFLTMRSSSLHQNSVRARLRASGWQLPPLPPLPAHLQSHQDTLLADGLHGCDRPSAQQPQLAVTLMQWPGLSSQGGATLSRRVSGSLANSLAANLPTPLRREGGRSSATGALIGTLLFRGFRVRVGIASGLLEGRDVVYRKAATGRMAYSGVCMQLAKLVSDAALGGMVLLSTSALEALQPWPRKELGGLVIWHKGRFLLGARDSQEDLLAQDLYQVVNALLAQRQVLLEPVPLRTVGQLMPGVLSAVVGPRVALCMVRVVGLATLMAWDERVTRESLRLQQAVALELLVEHGGYAAACEDSGELLAAFHDGASAVLWLLTLEEQLREHTEWPVALLDHELAEELEMYVPLKMPSATAPAQSPVARRSRAGAPALQAAALPAQQLPAAGNGSTSGPTGLGVGGIMRGISNSRLGRGLASGSMSGGSLSQAVMAAAAAAVGATEAGGWAGGASSMSSRGASGAFRGSMLGGGSSTRAWSAAACNGGAAVARVGGSSGAALHPVTASGGGGGNGGGDAPLPEHQRSDGGASSTDVPGGRQRRSISMSGELLGCCTSQDLPLHMHMQRPGSRLSHHGSSTSVDSSSQRLQRLPPAAVMVGSAGSRGSGTVPGSGCGAAPGTSTAAAAVATTATSTRTTSKPTLSPLLWGASDRAAAGLPLLPGSRSGRNVAASAQPAGSPRMPASAAASAANMFAETGAPQATASNTSEAPSSPFVRSNGPSHSTGGGSGTALGGGIAAATYSSTMPAVPAGYRLQRCFRGLRVRCAVEECAFWQNGSVSAAQLYRTQSSGKAYRALQRLCGAALMGQVVASWPVAKRIHRAALAGDAAARRIRLVAAPAARTKGMRTAAAAAVEWDAEADFSAPSISLAGSPKGPRPRVELQKAEVYVCTRVPGVVAEGGSPDDGGPSVLGTSSFLHATSASHVAQSAPLLKVGPPPFLTSPLPIHGAVTSTGAAGSSMRSRTNGIARFVNKRTSATGETFGMSSLPLGPAPHAPPASAGQLSPPRAGGLEGQLRPPSLGLAAAAAVAADPLPPASIYRTLSDIPAAMQDAMGQSAAGHAPAVPPPLLLPSSGLRNSHSPVHSPSGWGASGRSASGVWGIGSGVNSGSHIWELPAAHNSVSELEAVYERDSAGGTQGAGCAPQAPSAEVPFARLRRSCYPPVGEPVVVRSGDPDGECGEVSITLSGIQKVSNAAAAGGSAADESSLGSRRLPSEQLQLVALGGTIGSVPGRGGGL